MITLFRRGRVFWAESNFYGNRKRWSLETRDRQVAERLKRAYELEILGSGKLTPKKWPDFNTEFLAAARADIGDSTYDEYSRVLERFGEFFDAAHLESVADILPAIVTRYTESRRRNIHRVNHRPMSDGGIRYELRVLRRAFNYAIDCGYLEKNPVRARNLNSVAGRTQPFSQDDIDKMLGAEYLAGKPYLRAVVLLFLHTGLRISDVIYLERSSIAGGVLHRKTQKRKVVVRFPLHRDVLEAIAAIKNSQGQYVFTTETGQPIVSLDKHLRRLWDACGVTGGHAHRFRDTFAVRLLEKGASLYDVAKLLGISHQTAELHYTPYVKELQERGARLVELLSYGAVK